MKPSLRFVRNPILVVCLGVFVLLLPAANAQTTRKRPVARKPVTKPAPAPATTLPVFTPANAVEHGYVAGYSEGYLSGKSDYNANAPKDHQRSTIYQDANRGYEKSKGDLSEYQRGFKSGYEIGYNDGYIGREKNEKMPANLNTKAPVVAENTTPPVSSKPRTTGKSRFVIPPDTAVRIRLENQISTKTNQEGDKFTAFLVEPKEFEGATIEGHIAKLKRSGKLTGQTELALEFDRIIFKDGTSSDFRAQVERVYATEKVKTIDDEGNVQSGDTTKDTTIRSAGGAAIGAIIGAIGGGGKGAAIGAILGATVGAGSVFIQGKDLQLDQGTEIQVRTLGPKR